MNSLGADTPPGAEWNLVIHGGAGGISRERLDAEKQADYHDKLAAALEAGADVLRRGGAATDAVVAAITVMEDSPLFNAGKGAVFTHEGRNELDASIMDGSDHNAGAVASVTEAKNPILAARAVMLASSHVMLAGPGADAFIRDQGLELESPDYFFTQKRWDALQRAKANEDTAAVSAEGADWKFGTVGAVARDEHGNVAAGTSTGGMTNKRWGRIGDSPVIGAGTYASNDSCAVSATGHGEYFIRRTVARDICALMEYKGLSLAEAARIVIQDKLKSMGGSGGIVAVDVAGNMVMEFNSPGMFRGSVSSEQAAKTAMFGK